MFKVGDRVIGVPNNGYGWTTSDGIFQVIKLQETPGRPTRMRLRTLRHKHPRRIGSCIYVGADSRFRLIESAEQYPANYIRDLYAEAVYWG